MLFPSCNRAQFLIKTLNYGGPKCLHPRKKQRLLYYDYPKSWPLFLLAEAHGGRVAELDATPNPSSLGHAPQHGEVTTLQPWLIKFPPMPKSRLTPNQSFLHPKGKKSGGNVTINLCPFPPLWSPARWSLWPAAPRGTLTPPGTP